MVKIKSNKGFTLMELMIVLVIIGLLAGIGYPSYLDSAKKSRRSAAQADLSELAQYMERFYTENYAYDEDRGGVAVSLPFTESPKEGGSKYYDITLVRNPTTFTLTATPKGAQADDGILTLNQVGVRGWDSDNSGAVDAHEQCWERTCP